MNILNYIKQKSQQAIQGVGNFIDRDPNMGGVQLAQGGLGNRINNFFQGARDASPIAPQNYQNSNLQRNIQGLTQNLNIGNILRRPVNPQNPVVRGINFLDQNFTKPIENTAVGTILNPRFIGERMANQAQYTGDISRDLQDKMARGEQPSKLDYFNVGANTIGTLLPGIDDAVLGAYDYAKAKLANKDPQKAFVGSPEVGGGEYTGAGDALFGQNNPIGEAANLLELPALLAVGGLRAKNVDEIASKSKSLTNVDPRGVVKGTLKRTWDALVPSSKKVIEKSGESGKKIASILDKSDFDASLKVGEQQDLMNTALKALSKEEKLTFADVVEGNAKPISEAQAKAVEIWRAIAADIHQRASSAGMNLGKIENYFPHHVIEKGADTSKLKSSIGRASERRYGNLELSRQTELPYDKDPSVLFDYIENANKRISDVLNFGQNDKVLYDLADQAGAEGADVGQIKKYLNQILGKEQDKGLENVSQKIRNVQTFKLGPQSALTNLTQNISTLLRTDPKSVGKAIINTIKNPDQAISNAIRAGEIDPAQGARILSDVGSGNVVRKWLKLVGFTGAEKINRVLAVNSGIEYSNKLIKQAKNGSEAAVRELARLGFDTKNLDKIDPLLGGKAISEATQFSTKVGELPYGWQTPIGRILTQFKGFAYKQTQFGASEVKRIAQETKAGNFKPLANALTTVGVVAPIVGEIINDIKSVISNKERDTKGVERYVENIMGATSLGLFDSLGGLTGKYGEGGVISTLGGPAAGDLYKGADTIANIGSDQEYDRNRAIRNIVRAIPGIGTTAANTFIPNSYVDNKDIAGVNLGVNQGLNKTDKQTYLNMKQNDPQQAELFKERTQEKRKDGEGNFLSKILGGGNTPTSIPGKDATPAEVKEFNTQIKDVLDEGGVPAKESIQYALFNNKSADSSSIKERTDVYKSLKSVLENEYYTEEQKQAVIEASGAKPEDANYFVKAAQDVDVKLQEEIIPAIDQMDNEDLMIYLMQSRKVIGGKQMLTSTMIDYLYERDYIGKNEKEALKALKYDEIKDEFYYKKSFGSGGKISYAKALKLFQIDLPKFSRLKTLDLVLGKSVSSGTSQTDSGGDRLLSNILNRRAETPNIKFG